MVIGIYDDLKVERVEVKDVRVPEQLIQANFLFAHLIFIFVGMFHLFCDFNFLFKVP